jgi:glycosyltransferase involved in cell wall biosynthesis
MSLPVVKRWIRKLLPGIAGARRKKSGLPAPVIADADRSGVAIVAIVKDEERYIAEWIDYHALIGARAFHIYDNGSSDRTLEILQDARAAERITVIPWRNFDRGVRIQNAAYAHALANFGQRYRWMTFIDVDEFIVPKHHESLDAALATLADVPAISLPWHMFGPSGHDVRPPGLVIENYLERAEFPPRGDVVSLLNYKTIADPTKVRLVKTHHVELFDDGEAMWNDRKERFPYADRFDPKHATADVLQLNHYFTRSRAEMREKIAKGRVSKDGRTKNADYLEEQVRRLERYTARDTGILRFVPALKRQLPT